MNGISGIGSLGNIGSVGISQSLSTVVSSPSVSDVPSTVVSFDGVVSPKKGVDLYKSIQNLDHNINLISIKTGLNPKIVIDFIDTLLLNGKDPNELTDQLIIALLLELIKNKQIDPILGM